jgi:hypothetical protein
MLAEPIANQRHVLLAVAIDFLAIATEGAGILFFHGMVLCLVVQSQG